MLKFIKKDALKKHTATVIFMHGLGDSGNGWAPISDILGEKLPHVKFIFPHAPVKPVTLNYGMEMPAWYDIFSLSRFEKEDEEGLLQSLGLVKTLINNEVDMGTPSSRIAVCGFSQGAAMAYITGLTFETKLAGIVALSGYLPIHDTVFRMATDANKPTKIFVGHGTDDPVVRYELSTLSVNELKKENYNVEFKTYVGLEHSSCPQEILDLCEFLSKNLPETQ
ncbi:hypothetical protein BB560_006922 [Smittium megazygosporum]|uniref:Acyl-protein thioesterase 1 n=1 Tax=Smittium megazygosporum TaxID=133381 RepID=A0A2T9Y0A2_9FUNG|nr:hypothetical protein BB560_006922 [Smittium megazygosporum]